MNRRTMSAIAVVLFCVSFSIPGFSQTNPKLSDAEIASVAVVANQIDIDYADIAKERTKNSQILRFARTMADDHKAVIGQAVALAHKLGVTPLDNAISRKLLSDAEIIKKALRSESDQKFDKAYIDNEVGYHKAVISAVEGILIPETDNAELKALLVNVVPALRAHLEHAEMVQKQLIVK